MSPHIIFTSVPSSTKVFLQSQSRSAGHSVVPHRDVTEKAADSGRGIHQTIKPRRRTLRAAFGAQACERRLMEIQRNSAPQHINSSSMCEPTQRSCEPRRKRADERNAPPEMARIITDPATGKCYCRGKVLGKVPQAESLLQLLDLYPQTKTPLLNIFF